jgi:23S rRNA pseudouridine1911/1915/1917 synthase
LRGAFAQGRVDKQYLAIVAGTPPARVTLRQALAHDRRDRRRMAPAEPGTRSWPAETRIETLAVVGTAALVAATIRTGVTHQVRVHLAMLGHPVLGDALYGGPPAGLAPGRHALHASALTIAAPGRPLLSVRSPLPADLAALLS